MLLRIAYWWIQSNRLRTNCSCSLDAYKDYELVFSVLADGCDLVYREMPLQIPYGFVMAFFLCTNCRFLLELLWDMRWTDAKENKRYGCQQTIFLYILFFLCVDDMHNINRNVF